ncbi:MAG TPA: hypothetical protein VG605_13395 [Puia sp.]|jgi:hypothetical protein|nr:hypothetical protein [Puia sp.]
MKKIKTSVQLQLEQEKLAHRRLMLEEDIRHDWNGLRHHFEPAAFARETFFSGLTWIGHRIFNTAGRRHSA